MPAVHADIVRLLSIRSNGFCADCRTEGQCFLVVSVTATKKYYYKTIVFTPEQASLMLRLPWGYIYVKIAQKSTLKLWDLTYRT